MKQNDDMGLPDPPSGYGWFFGPKFESGRSVMLIGFGIKCFGQVNRMSRCSFASKGGIEDSVDVGEFPTPREAALALFSALGLDAP